MDYVLMYLIGAISAVIFWQLWLLFKSEAPAPAESKPKPELPKATFTFEIQCSNCKTPIVHEFWRGTRVPPYLGADYVHKLDGDILYCPKCNYHLFTQRA